MNSKTNTEKRGITRLIAPVCAQLLGADERIPSRIHPSNSSSKSLTSLGNILSELKGVIQAFRPEYLKKLEAPLEAQALAQVESELSLVFPQELKELYLWHNGQKGFAPLVGSWTFMRIGQVREAYFTFKLMSGSSEFSRENWWHKGWIPFLENGAGDHICLDTEGVFTGCPGQIITFLHDSAKRTVIASSLFSFFSMVVATYKASDWYEGEKTYIDISYEIGYPCIFMAGEASQ